jgi:hypothetical protein
MEYVMPCFKIATKTSDAGMRNTRANTRVLISAAVFFLPLSFDVSLSCAGNANIPMSIARTIGCRNGFTREYDAYRVAAKKTNNIKRLDRFCNGLSIVSSLS